jgi:hypothetical protein
VYTSWFKKKHPILLACSSLFFTEVLKLHKEYRCVEEWADMLLAHLSLKALATIKTLLLIRQ